MPSGLVDPPVLIGGSEFDSTILLPSPCIFLTRFTENEISVNLKTSQCLATGKGFDMAKTYVPMAVRLANGLHKRLTRYQTTISAQAVNDNQRTALVELISCLANFLSKWTLPPPSP